MATRDGGSAFPVPGYYPDDPNDHLEHGEREARSSYPQTGMTLRDWFAGQALQGILALHSDENLSRPTPKAAAEEAYEFADEMIVARVK